MRWRIRAFLISILSALLAGCATDDYYSQAIDACNFIPPLGHHYDYLIDKDNPKAPGCRTAIESVFKFDESFDLAPPKFRLRVLEALHALLVFPLAYPPENRILGRGPDTFTASFLHLFPPEQPTQFNRAAFNYIANRINSIRFVADGGGKAGRYGIDHSLIGGVMTLHAPFWDPSDDFTTDSVFRRAAVLFHESRHGGKIFHVRCSANTDNDCDSGFDGPYGYQVQIIEMFLRGSHTLMDINEIAGLGHTICAIVQGSIDSGPADLKADFVDKINCAEVANGTWTKAQENLK